MPFIGELALTCGLFLFKVRFNCTIDHLNTDTSIYELIF